MKPKSPKRPPAIDTIREQLAYRLPSSGRPLSTIVLPREIAQTLVDQWEELEAKLQHQPKS